MKKLDKLKNEHRNVIRSSNIQELKTFREELVKRLIKLRKKYNRWRFFEKDGVLGICAAVAFFSSALVWLPGIIGNIMVGIGGVSLTAIINVFIARIFVNKCIDIDLEEKEISKLMNEIDERTKELEAGYSTSFSYLSKPEMPNTKYSCVEEYIARKSDDFDL